jgi:hypothetical protein
MIGGILFTLCLGAAATKPTKPAVIALAPGEGATIASRLAGQRVSLARDGHSLTIDDIAGRGPPHLGVVERRGQDLVLVTRAGAFRLRGPLARPRLAGPGYTVWVIGHLDGEDLCAQRLGVLRKPA